jgi:hypothetical protein
VTQRRDVPIFNFAQANPRGPGQDDVPALLRRVSETIATLGAIDVHDLVLHTELTEDEAWHSLVVYYQRRGEARAEDGVVVPLHGHEPPG